MKPIRLLSCLLTAVAAFQLSASAQSPAPMPRRPNIILIVADGLAAGDLSCYGQTQFETPNLDKLAATGVRFTHYSAGAANSSPADAALMLGKYAGTNDVTLAPGDTTIARLLKDTGYFTSAIGEWNLGDEGSGGAPWLQGYDEFAGFFSKADAANAYAESFWRYECNPVQNDLQAYNGTEAIYANTGGKKVQYLPDYLVTLATTFVNKHQPFKFNHFRPFFLTLNYTIPGNGNRVVPTDAPYSEEPWPQPERNRAAMISRLDDNLGALFQKLNDIGQSSNTVVFFTSDTVPKKIGGTDPLFFNEIVPANSLYVPIIVSWPGKIPAGQVSDINCSARDFLPTAAALGLAPTPENIDGLSLVPALFGQTSK